MKHASRSTVCVSSQIGCQVQYVLHCTAYPMQFTTNDQ
jgi:adenine C2-methylase RlmN of 23S rRNA A2503 and tRNA A37